MNSFSYVVVCTNAIQGTVKPRNSGQLEQLDFFRYCGVFRYFEGSEALNRAFWGQKLSAIEGFSAISTSPIAGFYCTVCLIAHFIMFIANLKYP